MIRDAIGAVGEILGASAVVISLVYLAFQIKNQNKEARLSAMHDISVGFREAVAKFGTEDISKLVIRANANFDDLADDEALRLVTTYGGLFRAWEEAFIMHEEGRLDGFLQLLSASGETSQILVRWSNSLNILHANKKRAAFLPIAGTGLPDATSLCHPTSEKAWNYSIVTSGIIGLPC